MLQRLLFYYYFYNYFYYNGRPNQLRPCPCSILSGAGDFSASVKSAPVCVCVCGHDYKNGSE